MNTQTQHRIKQTLTENLERVCEMAEAMPNPNNHSDLARQICTEFKFTNGKGELQIATCLNAIHDLAAKGKLHLEKSTHQTSKNPKLICEAEPLPLPEDMPKQAEDVIGIEVVLVSTPEENRQWNTVYTEFSPKKTHTAIGKTIKYLIKWGTFILGMILFGSARINSADRDFWVGWDKATRTLYHKKINESSRNSN